MKRYLTIKNFRNINPIIINENSSNKKEHELKYGRLYLNGDMEQGTLISIIGANGTGKTNVLSAIEKTFTGNIDYKKDSPKIDGFINCQTELNVFIESYNGIIYKGKAEDNDIIWDISETNNIMDIIINKNYIYKILDNIFKFRNNNDNYYNQLFYVYENNYKMDSDNLLIENNDIIENKYNNEDKKENMHYDIILNYAVSKTMHIIDKYKEYDDINKLKLIASIIDSKFYEIDKDNNYYNLILDENEINNNNLRHLSSILAKIDGIKNTKIYVHRKNIKSDELTISCYSKKASYNVNTRRDNNNSFNFIRESNFLYSLFKSTNNMEIYEYLINIYRNSPLDVAFVKQIEKEINKLFENTISKKFNKLYRSNNEYIFKISLEENFIKIYFETKNGLTNLDNESDGFNWFFSLFFNTLNSDELKKGDIIIIDEPEQHLSVPLIRELREFLKQFAKDNGVTIITSIQIPYFADINYLDELKIVESKQDNIGVKIENDFSATYGKVDTLEKIINAFGVKHIDITRDIKIIYVEGITDYNYLTAFKILMEHIENKETNIAFMPINGVGRENDEDKKKIIIDSLCKLSKNPTLLIDGDNSANQFDKLAEGTNLKITQLTDINKNFITIEDLFNEKDKETYKIDNKNKDALYSSLFKNNIIDYYEKELISDKTINNFFKVIKEIS